MSGGVTTAIANKIVDHTTTVASFTAPTGPIKARLYTATGSAGVASNTGAVTFNSMPACTVTAVELWDSAGTPVRLWWGPLTASKTLNSGDTFQFDIGSLSVSVV